MRRNLKQEQGMEGEEVLRSWMRFSLFCLLLVLRNQSRNRAIVRGKVFLRGALHIFFGHRAVILRGLKEFCVIAKIHFISTDGVCAAIDSAHLVVKLDKTNVFRF